MDYNLAANSCQAKTATESSDLEMEAVGQMAGGENLRSFGSSFSRSYSYS